MWKSGVGRGVGSIVLVLSVLTGPFNAFSYGSATTHLEVTEAILGGYGGDDFRELFEVTSGAIDSMADDFEAHFPEMRKKFNPWTHRLMGHSWSLDEEVPERVLERLEMQKRLPHGRLPLHLNRRLRLSAGSRRRNRQSAHGSRFKVKFVRPAKVNARYGFRW